MKTSELEQQLEQHIRAYISADEARISLNEYLLLMYQTIMEEYKILAERG